LGRFVAEFRRCGGLWLFECLKLRVHNFNFDAGVLTVHDGKGKKDRTVPLPRSILPELLAQLEQLKHLHEQDMHEGWKDALRFLGRLGEWVRVFLYTVYSNL
jgi:integrase